MLIDHDEPVETYGKSGRDCEAESERRDDDRDRRDPGSLLAQLQPFEVLLRPARHYESDQSEQECERDRVAGLQEVDALGPARNLDRSRKRQEPGEADDQRRPRPASTA